MVILSISGSNVWGYLASLEKLTLSGIVIKDIRKLRQKLLDFWGEYSSLQQQLSDFLTYRHIKEIMHTFKIHESLLKMWVC